MDLRQWRSMDLRNRKRSSRPEQGSADAQFNFGCMKAVAELGHAEAQFNVGVMYDKGRGVGQDDVQALMWFTLAAAQGERHGQEALEALTERMTAEQIAEALRLAQVWKAKQPRKGVRDRRLRHST